MDRNAAVPLVRRLPLVAAMPPATQDNLAGLFVDVSEVVPLTPGEALIHEGALGGSAGYLLLEGAVEVTRECAPAVQLKAPALFGEMQQFNPQALRTATVTPTAPGSALKFTWQELYTRARDALSKADQEHFANAIEESVWERFHADALADMPLFRRLPDRLRLRASLNLMWVARPRRYGDGEELFAQGEPCGDVGFQLTDGSVSLFSGGQKTATLHAPALLGVMPEFDPDRMWTATARAQGPASACRFSWQEYMVRLKETLSAEDHAVFCEAARAAVDEHFAW